MMIGSNFDSASVMMGKTSGVAARLRDRIRGHHVTTHCFAHNLELAFKEVPYYTIRHGGRRVQVYFYSPKKMQPSQVSESLDEDNVRFGGVKAIRWLASQHSALVALHYAVTV